MDIIIENLPIVVMAATFLILLILLQTVIDFIDVRSAKKRQANLVKFAKKNCQVSFTAVIYYDGEIDELLLTIDSLVSQRYNKLQILVLVSHTSDSNALRQVRSSMKRNQLSNVQAVSLSKQKNIMELTARLSTGKLWILINSGDRLSNDFFQNASIEYLTNKNLVAALPLIIIRTDNTLASAAQAINQLFCLGLQKLYRFKFDNSRLLHYVVYVASDLKKRNAIFVKRRRFANPALHVSSPPAHLGMVRYINHLANYFISTKGFGVLFGLFSASLITYFTVDNQMIIDGLILIWISYVILSVAILSRLKGYGFINRLSLILFTPFNVLLSLFVTIYAIPRNILLSVYRSNYDNQRDKRQKDVLNQGISL